MQRELQGVNKSYFTQNVLVRQMVGTTLITSSGAQNQSEFDVVTLSY
jgi:hypothetical protein